MPATQELESAVEGGIKSLLALRGRDPNHADLQGTPNRFLRAMLEMTNGYDQQPEKILATRFQVDSENLIIVRGIDFVSLCEHHLLPFTGQATVAYIPAPIDSDDGRNRIEVVGLSKLARLVDCYARRFQIQERMTFEIVNAIKFHLPAKGIACIIKAVHSCMSCRGVEKPGAEMVTCELEGTFKTDSAARAELMQLAGY